MASDMSGHLDCMFDCGLKFSCLETLYLHVELDHREDSTVSPFAVHEPSSATASGNRDANYDHHASSADVQEPPQIHTRPLLAAPQGNGDDDSDDEPFVLCPEQACEEMILLTELNEHLDLHDAENDILLEDLSLTSSIEPHGKHTAIHSSSLHKSSASAASSSRFTTQIDPALRREMGPHVHEDDSSRAHIGRKFLGIFGSDRRSKARIGSNAPVPGTLRLGKNELGPYAHEARMPTSMYDKLRDGPEIVRSKHITRNGGLVTRERVEGQTNGILPILRRLIEFDPYVHKAYLCHPCVTDVGRTTWESGFCGFRNTQMMISYIQNSKHIAHTLFPGHIPGILDLQDWIEDAWAGGINSFAREEFGGLRGTRKWIGTLEVDTLLQHLGIQHNIHQFHDTRSVNNRFADENLLDWVEQYFSNASTGDNAKVQCTLKPPIYLQRPGHSITIIGMERMRNGTRNLLVFDPMYQAPKAMIQLIDRGERRIQESPTNAKLLRFYRRSQTRLEHYKDFEATTLEGDLPLFPAWDVINGYEGEVLAFLETTSLSYEIYPRDMFLPAFYPTSEFYGSLFSIPEARFIHNIPGIPMLPNLCVPQAWLRAHGMVPSYEKWMMPDFAGKNCMANAMRELIPSTCVPSTSAEDVMGENCCTLVWFEQDAFEEEAYFRQVRSFVRY